MSIYKDELFRFITNEENFELAAEISEVFPEVRDRLVEEFWHLVLSKLKIFDEKNEWKIDMNFKTKDLWISLEDDSIAYIDAVALDGKCYYGAYFEDDSINLELGYQLLLKNESINGFKKGKEWFYYAYTGDDFGNPSTLKKILPHNMDSYGQQLAKTLYELAQKTREDMIKINASKK